MAAFGKLELRAISWYAEEHGLVPQLSLYPQVTFTDKGVVHLRNIHNILGDFERNRKAISQKKAQITRELNKLKPVSVSLF